LLDLDLLTLGVVGVFIISDSLRVVLFLGVLTGGEDVGIDGKGVFV